MKIILTVLFTMCASYLIGQSSTGQEAADFSCSCTQNALTDNNVNVTLLTQITNDYELLSYTDFYAKHKTDIDVVYNQIKSNYDGIKKATIACRSLWQSKYQIYQNDKTFVSDFQKGLLECQSIQGMEILKKIKGEF